MGPIFSKFGQNSLGRGGGLYQPQADINVTPLVDVMLVLLIIFMVTAPMLATGLKVELPQAKQAQPLNPKEPIVVTIAKEGKLSLGSDETSKDQLIGAIKAKLDGDLTRTLHLRGDKDVPFGDIVAIMDLLASNGLTHIAIVADARAKPDTGLPKQEAPSQLVAPAAGGKTETLPAQAPYVAPAAPLQNIAPVAPAQAVGPQGARAPAK